MKNKYDFIKHHHDYLNDYIKFADAKALGVITINGLALNMIYRQLSDSMFDIKYLLLLLAFFLISIGIILSACVLLPRTSEKNHKGIIFWENVISYKKNEYVSEIYNISERTLIDKMVEQNYFLSSTATKKYSALRKAFFCSFWGYWFIVLSIIFWLAC